MIDWQLSSGTPIKQEYDRRKDLSSELFESETSGTAEKARLAKDKARRPVEPKRRFEPHRGAESPHRLPGGQMPEHLRVLDRKDRHVHARRRHLHASLRLLCR